MPDYEVKLWLSFPAADDDQAAKLAAIGEAAAERHAVRAINAAYAEAGAEPDTPVTLSMEGEPERT